jgi:uncharacterized coiled-coil DUF342 family protein
MTTLTKKELIKEVAELREELAHTKAVVSEIRADKYFEVKELNAEREELQEAYEGVKKELAQVKAQKDNITETSRDCIDYWYDKWYAVTHK